MKHMVRDMDLLEVAAMQWRQCVELAAQDGRPLGPDRYMEVRLEDLTLPKVNEVLNFLGLDAEDNVTSYFNETFNPDMSKSRRGKLTAAEQDTLRRILTPTMSWLGYQEPE